MRLSGKMWCFFLGEEWDEEVVFIVSVGGMCSLGSLVRFICFVVREVFGGVLEGFLGWCWDGEEDRVF